MQSRRTDLGLEGGLLLGELLVGVALREQVCVERAQLGVKVLALLSELVQLVLAVMQLRLQSMLVSKQRLLLAEERVRLGRLLLLWCVFGVCACVR